MSGVAGALRRPGRLPAGPPAVRRPPSGAPRPGPRGVEGARPRAGRRDRSAAPVPVRPRSAGRAHHAPRARHPGPGGGAPQPGRARRARRPRGDLPRAGAGGRRARAHGRAARASPAPLDPAGPLRAGHVLQALADRLPRDAILLEETPSSRPELHARIPATAPLGFLSAMGMLGFALPAAIGVRMATRAARPDGRRRRLEPLPDPGAVERGRLRRRRAVHRAAQRRLRDHGPARRARRRRRPVARDRDRRHRGAWRAPRAARRAGSTTYDELLGALDETLPGLRDRTTPLLLEVVVAQDETFDP